MARHVVVGGGGIGLATARQLVGWGHDVTLLTRSGFDPGIRGVRAAAVDATDAEALTAALEGAASLVNAANPSRYYTWHQDWPPMASAMLSAASRTGAGLVTVSNLYGYGPLGGPIRPDAPLAAAGLKGRIRAGMWTDALEAHRAGTVRATELRASDYFGPGAGAGVSLLNRFVIGPVAAGRPVWLINGVPDAAHSWTFLPDIGTLAATLATDDRSWGRAWHVPTEPPRTFRQVASDVAALCGRPAPAVRVVPGAVRALLHLSRTVRELDETAYQFERPFVLDSSATEATFGLRPTPWGEALERTCSPPRAGSKERVGAGRP